MNKLAILTKLDLHHLKSLYKFKWPFHASSADLVEHFINRFDKQPKWEEKVKFWTLNDTWRETGTFAMVNENDQHIFFNTLETYPYETLKRTLELLKMEQEMVFIAFRDIFRPMIHDVIRVQNLEKTFDSATRLMSMEEIPERISRKE